MDVEQAIEVIGKYGKFQMLSFILFCLIQIFFAFQMLLMSLIGATPIQVSNNAVLPWDHSTIITEYNDVCKFLKWNLFEHAEITKFIQSFFMFGLLIGNFVFGQLSDTFGRKYIFKIVFQLFVLFSFLTSFATNYMILGFIRFLVGIFLGGSILLNFVHSQELLPASLWTISGNLQGGCFALGLALLAWVGNQLYSWRSLCVATSLPAAILSLTYLLMPESPRWLYSQGKISQAEKVLRYLAEKNGVPSTIIKEIKLKPKRDVHKIKRKFYNVCSLFSNKELGRRTLAMGLIWFTCSLVYYGLTVNSGSISSDRFVSLALVGIAELPAFVLCTIIIPKVWAGRRRSLIVSLLVAAISCAGVVLYDSINLEDSKSLNKSAQTTASWNLKLLLALIGKLSISFAFSVIYIYSTELFPTCVRNIGLGVSSVCARFGGIISPFMSILALLAVPLPFVVYSGFCFTAVCVSFILPETLNCQIPDSIEELHPNSSNSYHKLNSFNSDDEV